MAGKSHLDELIDYKELALNTLKYSKAVMGLILNDPNIDMESDAVFEAQGRNFYDHAYLDETILRNDAFIMIDVDMTGLSSPEMKSLSLFVQPVCSKGYMELDRFPGVRGNRLDNLCREIDLILNGSRDFGIGKLSLDLAITKDVPKTFASKIMLYPTVDFAIDRRLRPK